jgi:hypothetical protein
MRRANEQALRLDPSGRLMGIHLRLLGIDRNDDDVRSEEEVTEMLEELQELRREWGRRGGLESMRRANEQALRLDPSGRLMGIHLRFLGIDRNDDDERSEEEVTEMLRLFCQGNWTEEDDAMMDTFIAANPVLTKRGAKFPSGLYVLGSVNDGREMAGREKYHHIQLIYLTSIHFLVGSPCEHVSRAPTRLWASAPVGFNVHSPAGAHGPCRKTT